MIQIHNVSKSFSSKEVLKQVSFSIPDGQVTALAGANGCGKTTIIRLISGLLKPDFGTIHIPNGEKIGVLLGGDVHLYDNLSGYENLKYFANLRNVSDCDFNLRCAELSDFLGFHDFIHERSCYYSRGMRQKIAFAIALIHSPSILLLDEPSTGLDIPTMDEVLQFIEYCKASQKTILLSTHNIFEIADLSDNLIILRDKSVSYEGKTKDFFSSCTPKNQMQRLSASIAGGYTI